MHRALLVADSAAGAPVIVEHVCVVSPMLVARRAARPDLDDRVLRAGTEAPVALEAIAARQAASRLVFGLVFTQTANYLGEIGDAAGRLALGLAAARGIGEIPRV